MKLTVLGATGGVGQHIVRQALDDGHQVTAVVRDPARLTARHDALTVSVANALDAASLTSAHALAGADAVLSGMGQAARRDALKPASASARAAVTAMKDAGVRRIVVVSAGPLNRAGTGQNALVRTVLNRAMWSMLGELYRDLELMERVLQDSGLDWTAVRPPRLTDAPGRGTYRSGVDSGPAGTTATRADVARAMLDSLTDTKTYGHALGMSN
jgi:putative NADH-flavin reductase